MIVGVGTDLVDSRRFESILARHGARFAHRILTVGEYQEYLKSRTPARFLAKRFAAKEAFAKAWGTGIGKEVSFLQLAICHTQLGQPVWSFSGTLAAAVQQRQICSHLSLSDEGDLVLAFVVLETGETGETAANI